MINYCFDITETSVLDNQLHFKAKLHLFGDLHSEFDIRVETDEIKFTINDGTYICNWQDHPELDNIVSAFNNETDAHVFHRSEPIPSGELLFEIKTLEKIVEIVKSFFQ
jgi:hypothetical protein